MKDGRIQVQLFEYDQRFEAKYREQFVHYDYNQPHSVPGELRGVFDCIIADPPFLADECLVKVAQTMKLLASGPSTKIVLCTGLVMQELVSATNSTVLEATQALYESVSTVLSRRNVC